MRVSRTVLILALSSSVLAGVGCENPRGKPGPEPEVVRPDHVLDFATLYKQNCVACHGDADHYGPAISLVNPVYLAVAGEDNIVDVLNHGRPGKLMPAFGEVGGGLLTEQQVHILAKGLITTWGKPDILNGLNPPKFKTTLTPNPVAGQKVFSDYCTTCHGTSGQGGDVKGAIVDPAFLGLVSDQNLRSIVISGMNSDMPDFRQPDNGTPLTDQNVTDVVAWLASHRTNVMKAAPEPATKEPSAKAKESKQ
jgi:mono/diheme cytochrome c family protein